ncbi:thioesterase family protein [Sphingomonas sp. BK235]|jgi:acyl-CoA thioesterase|uniref:thioesterase family protein n=1 Tax=Sphingomonas sp. BK235 TaxID=2512131 RepID=UPI001051F26B|nr:thioesterase family protein [Sphingomonas sp. BK235]TCP36767.1 acyl-CoA thioesterase [Sphingomonas sp. BK235]
MHDPSSPTGLPRLLEALTRDGAATRWHGSIPDDWLQGRTAYGGVSSAIALHCARQVEEALPPLRSAQIAFVGPLAGAITVEARLLRRGRNAAFVAAEVSGAQGLGLRCTFVFMRSLAGALAHERDGGPAVEAPAPDDVVLRGHPQVAFTRHFAFVDRPDADDPASWRRWARLEERDGLHPEVELVAIGDCLPPAALRLLGMGAPVSSMTWTINLLGAATASADGWWLVEAVTDHARDGGSSQRMAIRDAAGRAVAEQIQSVAIFG